MSVPEAETFTTYPDTSNLSAISDDSLNAKYFTPECEELFQSTAGGQRNAEKKDVNSVVESIFEDRDSLLAAANDPNPSSPDFKSWLLEVVVLLS